MERSRRIEEKKEVERGYRIVGIEGSAVGFCKTVGGGWLHAILRIDGKKVFILFPGRELPFLRAARIAAGYSNSFRRSHWNLTETIYKP